MAKITVIVGFLSSFLAALWVFHTRDLSSLRENLLNSPANQKPRVIFDQFIVRGYENEALVLVYRAQQGRFDAPNVGIAEGKVFAWRIKAKQQLQAQKVSAYFSSTDINQVFDAGKVDYAVFQDRVQLDVASYQILSKDAIYRSSDDSISSDEKVRIRSKKAEFWGNNGFSYQVGNQELFIRGRVEGVFTKKEHGT